MNFVKHEIKLLKFEGFY